MRVELYSPERMYGFAENGPERVFFHLGAFVAGEWPTVAEPPGPIIGEEVKVEYDPEDVDEPDKAPRATVVARVAAPVNLLGVVDTFNADRGWGWVRGDDGHDYYLHRSEVEGGRLPMPGQEVMFFRGRKNGRLRACYVRVGRFRG